MTMQVPQLPSRSRMNITDIPAELQEKILRNIEDYSIVLLVDGQLCGTGTLIIIDGVHGILTAAHVAQTLDESERAGTLATVLDRRGSQTRRRTGKTLREFLPPNQRVNGGYSDPTLPLCGYLLRAVCSPAC